ncbi:hypothetical protein BY996DRAFT_2421082 [Phakopsora pachyrhizi]|uniref:Uncharacterized protein n=1 Tax=Phakopsora pachyrhizi TaxID=170000 RepID=A0AAV0BTC1_PHAPC|nr:hypothetical protein BY996DRAFT_2421082 [Phakopsora pachyrhizi]CAH7689899.1 hypothetical protein PPACK8108_LOCUS25080 [Phakopsora pachyrhizi]
MYSTRLFDYLATYLPLQVAYAISAIFFFIEKVALPKFHAVFSSASLDPNTLLPFVFSAIALYISVVSIYHAFRASIRLVWWTIKWSIVIVLVWLALGIANEIMKMNDDSKSGHYGNVRNDGESFVKNWLNTLKSSNPLNSQARGYQFSLLNTIFGQGFVSVYEYSNKIFSIRDFDSTYSKHSKNSQPDSKSRSSNKKSKNNENDNSQNHHNDYNSYSSNNNNNKRGSEPKPIIISEETKKIWNENFQKPFQNFIGQVVQNHKNQKNNQKNR